ncbi:MAG: hypothetical protein M1814_004420 [Vezdaea aestivalis]|nr:MAG: hypothetical protein M1814_004420 [Vezdaea aestivalis]
MTSPSKRGPTMTTPERSCPSKHPKTSQEEAAAIDATTVDPNPFLSIFTYFRDELDEHHDRRERLVKLSRDITASSKKLIFGLQRTPKLGGPLASTNPHFVTIAVLLTVISEDLPPMARERYARQISPCLQELVEALLFGGYLSTQTLPSLSEFNTQRLLPLELKVGHEDYLLGLCDLVGELMRWAIGHVRDPVVAGRGGRTVVGDLQAVRRGVEGLDCGGEGLGRDVGKKLEVLRTCVEKVEGAACGFVVRGSERPEGWVPDRGD